MKKFYLLIMAFAAFLTSFTTFGQTNHIPNAGTTQTFGVLTGDHFFDPGGPGGGGTAQGTPGNYPNCNCDTFTTLAGATQIEFLSFFVFATYDYLKIYDGTDNTGTILFDNASGGANSGDIDLADMIASHGSATFTSTTGNFFFEFHASSVVDYEGWDVVVQSAASATCPAPTSLVTSNVQITTADLDWTEAGTATTWDVYVVPAGDPSPMSTTVPSDAGVTSKPFNKTGLTPGTNYEFYARADCGGGDLSVWAGPFSFVTNCLADKTVSSTATPSVYTDTDDSANFGDNYSGAPGSNCGTTADYLGGNEVVYYYTAGDSYALNIAMSGLSAGGSGVFIYENCLDIGTQCFDGMTNATTTDYDFNILVQNGEDYYIVVSSSAATSTLGYTLTLTETASPCQALAVTNTTGATIPCVGSGTLQATGTGIGNDIYWYNAATGGDIVGIGSSFTTPELTATTSYWAAEVITGSGSSGGGALPSYCVPTFTSGCTSDNIDDFILMDSSGIKIIEHLGTGCSTGAYGDYTGDPNLTGNLVPGNTYNFSVTSNYSSEYFKIWIDMNGNGSFADAGELLFTSSASSGGAPVTGSIVVPSNPLVGTTVMRVRSADFSAPTDACSSDSYGEVHDYKILLPSVVCESPRMQATATISTSGDVQVSTLPYTTTDDTANYGDPYEGAPGTDCGITENYLNGNDVVYKFTAPNTELVDILMSDLTAFYASVFVYESCADVGTTCVAGAVAGATDTDFGIENFQVTAGEDYYIVVSSWLSPSYGYTLDIIPFSCSSLLAPTGDTAQNFVAGDFVSDLVVSTTETGATLTWHSATPPTAANAIADPTTEPLVDATTYYVTQTFNGCVSPALAVTAHQIDCSSLAITATSGDTVSCKGILNLSATGSGTGDEIYWYTANTGGTPVGSGAQFETPVLTTTTSYWVSEAYATGTNYPGQGMVAGSGDLDNYQDDYGLVFDATQAFTIVSVDVYNEDAAAQTIDIELRDSNGAMVQSLTGIQLPAGNGTSGGPSAPTTVTLNFNVPPGTDWQLVAVNVNADLLQVTSSQTNFPYPLGPNGSTGQITTGKTSSSTSGQYNYFFNWTISTGAMICESTRQEVIATVNQTGDVLVDWNDLPYSTTDNTSTYGNDFSGGPGTDCDGTDYLDGNDVVYQYTADSASDDILDIELSGISNPNTGMYIYASCGDVGATCLAGGTNEDGLVISVEDYYITGGESIFIVISSQTSTTNYTLTINGVDCANVAPPTTANSTPYFIAGDVLDDLAIDQNQYSTGLTWYSALPPTPANEIDPTTTTVVDGTTYYVTQTLLGCEGAPLTITPAEFPCQDMKIDVASPDMLLCAPGGLVTLTAQGSGIGSEVYWYDAPTGGNLVNTGSTFDTNVSTTTSYWVEEVYIAGEAPLSGQAKVSRTTTASTTATNYGVQFDVFKAFTLVSVEVYPDETGSSTAEFELQDNTGAVLYAVNVSLPSGDGSTAVTVPLNFNIPPGTDYRLMRINNIALGRDSGSSNNAFPYDIGPGASIGSVTSGAYSSSSTTTSYYFFYNWTISTGTVACESARTQITVTINDQPTATPTTALPVQKFCEGDTIGDIAVTGTHVQWYSDPTGGALLSPSTPLVDGATYYATQTIDACESVGRLMVDVFVSPNAIKPVGDANQPFYQGQTISDLVVQGNDLTWYENSDATGEITDPTTFVLQNYETYYVGQSPQGFCESELLAITVHELLGADDPLFDALNYYPNPVKHKLTITNNAPIESIKLYNLLGQEVLQQQANDRKMNVDVSRLQSGTYFLWITIDGKTGAFKLIKE